MYKTTKEFSWPEEVQISIMQKCVWPILKPNTSSSSSDIDKIHHMSKIADLFQCWTDQDQYRYLFFLNLENGNDTIISKWISTSILTSAKIEPIFKERVVNVMCDLILKLADIESEYLGKNVKENLLPSLSESIQQWLSKGKIKMEKVTLKMIFNSIVFIYSIFFLSNC